MNCSRKTCIVCLQEKDLSSFSVRATSRDGYRNNCKLCHAAAQRNRRIVDPINAKEIDRRAYENNREAKLLCKIRYRENNRDKHRADRARRKQQKRSASPVWADKFLVDLIFTKARRLELWLGEDFQVDHVVPLMSDFVCGLHCEANLQILPKLENMVKGNRYWPDMW